MYEFIRLQYIMGNINADQVKAFAPNRITEEQAAAIVEEGGIT